MKLKIKNPWGVIGPNRFYLQPSYVSIDIGAKYVIRYVSDYDSSDTIELLDAGVDGTIENADRTLTLRVKILKSKTHKVGSIMLFVSKESRTFNIGWWIKRKIYDKKGSI